VVTISKTRLHALETAAWMNRAMIALVYIWFGLLKVLGTSPAEGLVTKLFNLTNRGVCCWFFMVVPALDKSGFLGDDCAYVYNIFASHFLAKRNVAILFNPDFDRTIHY
jgi:hypothetical protein